MTASAIQVNVQDKGFHFLNLSRATRRYVIGNYYFVAAPNCAKFRRLLVTLLRLCVPYSSRNKIDYRSDPSLRIHSGMQRKGGSTVLVPSSDRLLSSRGLIFNCGTRFADRY